MSTQGICPSPLYEHPAATSARAARAGKESRFEDEIIPAPVRAGVSPGRASRIRKRQKAKSAAAIPAATRPPAKPTALSVLLRFTSSRSCCACALL